MSLLRNASGGMRSGRACNLSEPRGEKQAAKNRAAVLCAPSERGYTGAQSGESEIYLGAGSTDMKSEVLHNPSRMARAALGAALLLCALSAQAGAQVNAGERNKPVRSLPPESSSRPLPGTSGAVIVGSDKDAESLDPSERQRARMIQEQLQDDFLKMQLIHNEMMTRTFTPGRAPDYGYISDTTGEIKKRANRLKNNLGLPASKEVEKEREKYKVVADAAQLKQALTRLDELMMSFVGNPVFQKTRTIDVEQSNKALRDLLGIIEFSQGISKDAERLNKTVSTPKP
jgi:hypothetical protein